MPELTCSIDSCRKSVLARGWCRAHYTRWYNYGDPTHLKGRTGRGYKFIQMAISEPGKSCILWPYYVNSSGYGRLQFKGRMTLAHRLSLTLFSGDPEDPGLLALHGPCHNPGCVNPLHLRWGTSRENSSDQWRDGTEVWGEKNARSKLKEHEVRHILTCDASNLELAVKYGVDDSTICRVRKRQTWRHLKI